MTYRPVHGYVEFRRRVEVYHDDDRDTRLYLEAFKALRDNNSYSIGGVKMLVDTYLIGWGRMSIHGVLPLPGTSGNLEHQKNLYHELTRDSALISDIKQMAIGSLTRVELGNIGDLFGSVSNVSFNYNYRTKRLGETSAGKILHMLAWRSRIIWDNEHVRRDGKCYSADKTGYREYLKDKQAELATVLREISIQEIAAQHADFLREKKKFKDAFEPITKLLDEINY
jgi:hypothetical protein